MEEKDEIQLYHLICDISKICKEYFYDRKYMPQDCWSIDTVVKSIYQKSKTLNKKFNEIKNTK